MAKAQKIDMTVERRWGFWNIISTATGVIVVGCAVILGIGFFLAKLFNFIWPTIQWVIVILVIATPSVVLLYKTMKMPDSVVRTHRCYQATLVCVRTVLILIILFADMRTVVGL